jgi:hypothetical protein
MPVKKRGPSTIKRGLFKNYIILIHTLFFFLKGRYTGNKTSNSSYDSLYHSNAAFVRSLKCFPKSHSPGESPGEIREEEESPFLSPALSSILGRPSSTPDPPAPLSSSSVSSDLSFFSLSDGLGTEQLTTKYSPPFYSYKIPSSNKINGSKIPNHLYLYKPQFSISLPFLKITDNKHLYLKGIFVFLDFF